MKPVLKQSHMYQPKRSYCGRECHISLEPLKMVERAVLYLNDFKQFSTEQARSSERRAVIVIESNSTQSKEMLCTGESLLFFQLN